MSTYREIVGKKIKKVSSDPSTGLDGQMWYNSTTGTLRAPAVVEAWISGSPLSTDRYAMGCAVTQTASVAAGGGIAAPPYVTAVVEEYNGSGWSTAPSLNTARGGLGSSKDGSQTAMLVFGGTSNSTATESFNGSAWTTTPNSLTTGKSQTSGAGTQGSALNAGRWGPPMIGNTEEWDGSSWSEQEDLNTARGDMACFGTQTAAIFAGGNSSSPPNYRNLAEQYDGSSWTVLPTLNTARGAGGSGAGSTTSGLVFGGNTPGPAASNASESWDGTSWTNTPSLAEAGARVGNGATGSAALAVGDYPITGVTEEYNRSTNTITAGAWASSGVLPAAWYGVGSSTNGTQDSAILFAGNNPGAFTGNTSSFEYDGSSWSADPSMSTARAYLCGFGTATAGVGAGGLVPPGATGSNAVEEYTTSWTTGNTIPQAGWNQGACGTLTAGIVAFGTNPTFPGQYAKAFEYDGTNWTAANDGPTATNDSKAMGTQTSALFAGGGPPSPEAKQSYEYDGTNWTAGGSLSVDHKAGQTLGSSQNAGLIGGGHTSPQTAVEGYDGTAWSSRPSMSTSRGRGGMSGTESAGVVAGGNPSATTATEEWTGETSTINIEDFTTS